MDIDGVKIPAEFAQEAQGSARPEKDEFCKRFVARMVARAPFEQFKNEDGSDGLLVAEYAADVASTYFDDDTLDDLTPEDCADEDMSYWGE